MSTRLKKNARFKTLHGEITRTALAKQKADKRNSKPKKIASQEVKDGKLKVKENKRQKYLLKKKGQEAIKSLGHKNSL